MLETSGGSFEGAVPASRGMMVEFVKQVHLQKDVGAVCLWSAWGCVFGRWIGLTGCEGGGKVCKEEEEVA